MLAVNAVTNAAHPMSKKSHHDNNFSSRRSNNRQSDRVAAQTYVDRRRGKNLPSVFIKLIDSRSSIFKDPQRILDLSEAQKMRMRSISTYGTNDEIFRLAGQPSGRSGWRRIFGNSEGGTTPCMTPVLCATQYTVMSLHPRPGTSRPD